MKNIFIKAMTMALTITLMLPQTAVFASETEPETTEPVEIIEQTDEEIQNPEAMSEIQAESTDAPEKEAINEEKTIETVEPVEEPAEEPAEDLPENLQKNSLTAKASSIEEEQIVTLKTASFSEVEAYLAENPAMSPEKLYEDGKITELQKTGLRRFLDKGLILDQIVYDAVYPLYEKGVISENDYNIYMAFKEGTAELSKEEYIAIVKEMMGITEYTVTFVDGVTGSTISTATVEEGSDATLPAAPSHNGYVFKQWDKDGKNITADTTITAVYEKAAEKFTVTFIDGVDKKTLKTETVESGKAATAPNAPAHTGYTFSKWDKAFNNVTGNLTVTAVYNLNTYTVTFKHGVTNKVISTVKVQHGKAATAPNAPAVDGYTFDKWDKAFNKITGNLTVTAKYKARNGWATVSGKKVYYTNGKRAYGQKKIGNYWYYFGEDGTMKTGIVKVLAKHNKQGAKTCYYDKDGHMRYGQQKIGNAWYMFDLGSGAMKTGWFTHDKKTNPKGGVKKVYYDTNGQMVKGQKKIGNYWYMFDPGSGKMVTGWYNHTAKTNPNGGAKRVYYDNNGRIVTGQRKISGKWYMFNPGSGKMVTGFYNHTNKTNPNGGAKTVYYNSKGQMVYGQQKVGKYWYMFDMGSGKMVTGWYNHTKKTNPKGGAKKVYYDKNGHMLYGVQIIGDKRYTFNKGSGALEKSENLVMPTKVSLDKTSATLEVGKTLTLKATVSPTNAYNKKVSWTSSNTKVATVDANGKVTAKAAGTANITVKTNAGGKTATCKVTVKKKGSPTPATGVEVSPSTGNLLVGEKISLSAKVTPSNATYDYIRWSSSDKSIASVDQKGVVTGTGVGRATIYALVVNKDSSTVLSEKTYASILVKKDNEVATCKNKGHHVVKYNFRMTGDTVVKYCHTCKKWDDGGSEANSWIQQFTTAGGIPRNYWISEIDWTEDRPIYVLAANGEPKKTGMLRKDLNEYKYNPNGSSWPNLVKYNKLQADQLK